MFNVRSPQWAYVVLLAVSMSALTDHVGATRQIICSQTDPNSCLAGSYCDSNGMCVPLKTGSDKTTTYVILGCVLGGVVIIVAVIVILYCGRWSWLTRLKNRFGGDRSRQTMSGMSSQYQQTPGISWAKSLRKRFKLKVGGVKRNPYVGNPAVSGMAMLNSQLTTNTALNTTNPAPVTSAAMNASRVLQVNTPVSRSMAMTTNIAPTNEGTASQEPIHAQYVVREESGQTSGMESSNPTPYVATVELKANDVEPMRRPQPAGGLGQPSYAYVSGSRHSLNELDAYRDQVVPYQQQSLAPAYYLQASPELRRPQISIQSPVPSEPLALVPAEPAVLEPAPPTPPPAVVPHTHQVYPSLYPSLGHGHTHTVSAAPPTYAELARKY